MTGKFFSADEGMSTDEREAKQLRQLRKVLTTAKQKSRYYRQSLRDIDPQNLTSLADLSHLPILRKSDMPRLQGDSPPFGGVNAHAVGDYARLFISPGPIYEASQRGDFWRLGAALFAAGFGKGDIVLNSFSYHLSPGGVMMEAGAHAVGAAVIPAGTGNSQQQALVASHYRATGYSGVPDFLKTILQKADASQLDLSSLNKALFSGGALFEDLRDYYSGRGIDCYQCLAAADVGLIAFESEARRGMLIAEDIIVELLLPDGTCTDDIGEITVTLLNEDFPLIRYAIGDLSRFIAGVSACGRTNRRIAGWLGRVDMICKIKGVFVHPHQLQQALQDFTSITAYSLVVNLHAGHDVARLHYKAKGRVDEVRLQTSLADYCRLRIEVMQDEGLVDDPSPIDDKRF